MPCPWGDELAGDSFVPPRRVSCGLLFIEGNKWWPASACLSAQRLPVIKALDSWKRTSIFYSAGGGEKIVRVLLITAGIDIFMTCFSSPIYFSLEQGKRLSLIKKKVLDKVCEAGSLFFEKALRFNSLIEEEFVQPHTRAHQMLTYSNYKRQPHKAARPLAPAVAQCQQLTQYEYNHFQPIHHKHPSNGSPIFSVTVFPSQL